MHHKPHPICQLCGRTVSPRLITLHHLTPKQKGGKAEHRTPLCRPCHSQIHATFSNTELVQNFTTIESLRETTQLRPFLSWIRKQKSDRTFKTTAPTRERIRIRRRSR
ncbi:MAG TPA: HNH endonuclease signature motif containing protein [Tepidisphaeraceae bacterium]|jgi:hypothetical protein